MKITKKLDKNKKTLNVKVKLEKSNEKQRVNAQKVFNYMTADDKLAEEVVLTSILKNDTIVSSPDESVEGEWCFSVSLIEKPTPKKKTTRRSSASKKDDAKDEE